MGGHTYVLRNGAGVIFGGGLYRAEDFRSYPPTGLTVIIILSVVLLIGMSQRCSVPVLRCCGIGLSQSKMLCPRNNASDVRPADALAASVEPPIQTRAP